MGWFSNKFDFKSEEDIEKLVKKHGALAVILPDGTYGEISYSFSTTLLTKSKELPIFLSRFIGIDRIKILGKFNQFLVANHFNKEKIVTEKAKVYDIEVHFTSGKVLKGTISDEVIKSGYGDEFIQTVNSQMLDSSGYVIFDENGAESKVRPQEAKIDYTKLQEVDEYDVELTKLDSITEFILKPAKL
jgi:hypothetical protein